MSETSEMIRTKFGETDTKRNAGLETPEDVVVITAVEKNPSLLLLSAGLDFPFQSDYYVTTTTFPKLFAPSRYL